jgi:crossover junction endodeoxyribonuclease RuvC
MTIALVPDFRSGADGGEAVASDRVKHAYRPRVVGVDLSLASTGVASYGHCERIKNKSLPKDATLEKREHRLESIALEVVKFVGLAKLVVIEGPAYGSNDPGAHERAGLWWRVVGKLVERAVPVVVVAPTTLKVYACGKGNAGKDVVMLAVAKRYPDAGIDGNDTADAYTLAAMGYHHLGHELAQVPVTHSRALDTVKWPASSEVNR